MKKIKMKKNEMKKVVGGCTTEELIAALWAACPSGGSLTVTNQGGGEWEGSRTYNTGSMDHLVVVDCIVGYYPVC